MLHHKNPFRIGDRVAWFHSADVPNREHECLVGVIAEIYEEYIDNSYPPRL
jgi:hypothetical protein